MQTYIANFSKLLDKTNNHLSLQSISSYINLPEQLNDNEKEFIHNHLTQCKSCSDSFDLIFDETLELDGKKNIINLIRQIENEEEESTVYSSKNNKVEIEVTRLSEKDFNLRFKSLTPGLIKEKAALKAGGRHFLRILSMDTDTMFIVHSDDDITKFDSFELISVTVTIEMPDNKPEDRPDKIKRLYWYAVISVIIGASLIIYLTLRTGFTERGKYHNTFSLTDRSPEEKSPGQSGMTSDVTPEQISKSEKDQSASADIFAINQTLEAILDKNKINDPLVALISPSVGATIKMPVTFEWLTSRKNITLKFVILSNQNIPVYNNLINGRELTIDTKLGPGLYYWKLESKDSIEALGKFLIK